MQDLEFTIEKKVKIVSNDITDMSLCDKLIEKIKLNIDPTLSYKTNVPHMTAFERFNGDPDFHNFLKLIQPDIKKIWQKSFIIKDSWGVIMNEGDSTDYHSHEGEATAFCGVLYLTSGGPGTSFPEIKQVINSVKGRFILFNPIMKHFVAQSKIKQRFSLAFNMTDVKSWDKTNIPIKI